jgi:GH24 family phage-related lysozyme (muramidase)
VSLCFNVGIGAFSMSKFLQMIRNNCSNPAIAKGFESFGNVRNREGKLVYNDGLQRRNIHARFLAQTYEYSADSA